MISLTFDIDWAPDWAIELCAEICRKAGVKATFYVTHSSEILADLRRDAAFELGIHPNFLPNSSHGSIIDDVLSTVLSYVPEAKSMRTHALMQSSPLFLYVIQHTAIKIDVSLLLPFHRNLRATRLYVEEKEHPLIRLPYYWEDALAACWPGWSWLTVPEAAGEEMRIYSFHPVHVALNTDSMGRYRALKEHLGDHPLTSATEKDCANFVNTGEGARTFLERLVACDSSERYPTITELADKVETETFVLH